MSRCRFTRVFFHFDAFGGTFLWRARDRGPRSCTGRCWPTHRSWRRRPWTCRSTTPAKKGPKIIIVPTCNMICKLEVKTHHTICGNDKFLFLVVKGHLFSVFRMTSTPTIFRRKLVMENAPLLLQYVTKNVSKFSNYDQLLLSLHRKKRKKIAIVVTKMTPIKMVK